MMNNSNLRKITRSLLSVLAISAILCSCNETFTNIGIAIRPEQDDIDVYTDTFVLDAENWMVPAISAQADTMVLGCFESPVYGMTKADLLIQLAAPEGYTFPDSSFNPTPDSLVMLLYYNSYFGDPYAPIQFSVYEMTGDPIRYTERYYSNLAISQFCDSSTTHLLGDRTFTAIDLNRRNALSEDSASTPYVRYKFNETQVQRFFDQIRTNPSISTSDFLNTFKGMFITSTYGSSTMLYLNQASLYLYYHYSYRRDGRDTIVKTSIAFPANHEVRQLNRFSHPDREQIVASIPDSLLYIKSAAGLYPKIRIPLNRIRQKIYNKVDTNRKETFYISVAEVEVECIENDYIDEYTLEPAALLAIASSSFDDFLKNNKKVESYMTDRILATYSSSSNSYVLDFAALLNRVMRDNTINPDSVLEFVLVPLNIEYQYSSSSAVTATSVKPLVKLAATRVRSHRNQKSPLRLKLFFEGF